MLYGDLPQYFVHQAGFVLERQLGQGRTSEAWLARALPEHVNTSRSNGGKLHSVATVENVSRVVLKIRSRGFKFPDLVAFSIGHDCRKECGIARMLVRQWPSLFVNCSATGVVDVAGGAQLEYVAQQIAPGDSLEDLVWYHANEGVPHAKLAMLAQALDVFFRVFEIVDMCRRPDSESGRLRFYFPDLQLGNALISDKGEMTFIDYDRIEHCAEDIGIRVGAAGNASSSATALADIGTDDESAVCDSDTDDIWTFVTTRRLIMIFFQLLMGVLPSRSTTFIHIETRVFRAWQVAWYREETLKRPPLANLPNVTQAVEDIVAHIFPAYLEDWRRLPGGAATLASAFTAAHEFHWHGSPAWPPLFVQALRKQRGVLENVA